MEFFGRQPINQTFVAWVPSIDVRALRPWHGAVQSQACEEAGGAEEA